MSVTTVELSQLIEKIAPNSTVLDLRGCGLEALPENIGDLTYLTKLNLNGNRLTSLPESIGKITKLTELYLNGHKLTTLPESIGNLTSLTKLHLNGGCLHSLPDSIANLIDLTEIKLNKNQFDRIPDILFRLPKLKKIHLRANPLNDISRVPKLTYFSWDAEIYPLFSDPIAISKNRWDLMSGDIRVFFCYYSGSSNYTLHISSRQLQYLPKSLSSLKCLNSIHIGWNSLTDLSILNELPNLSSVYFLNADLPRRYWTRLSKWKPEWLLDENNIEIRRRIIDRVGYEEICEALNAIKLDTWREYTLLKIENFQPIYEGSRQPTTRESIVLLKMNCPSTGHVHILRVPPDMISAEEAIVWVNHGIHPDRFTMQT